MSEEGEEDLEHQRRMTITYRLEALDAVALAFARRDELIALVASASDSDDARTQLRAAFGVSEIQATVVMDLQISRFSERERERVLSERDRLRAELD
jgi:DNA gyrase subunit A